MDDKAIYFLLILIGGLIFSFWLMSKSKKGLIVFFCSVSTFLILNLIHLNWLLNLPKTSKWAPNLGEAVGYVIATLLEVIFLLVLSVIWYFVLRNKKKKV